jgi:hypothetical protein
MIFQPWAANLLTKTNHDEEKARTSTPAIFVGQVVRGFYVILQ